MDLKEKKIGFIMTDVFYTFRRTIDEIKKLMESKAHIIPIMSEYVYEKDTKYGKAKEFTKEIENITNEKIYNTIKEIEEFYNTEKLDIIIVSPASGNIIGKLANNICDDVVTYTIKAHLKYEKPVVIAIATNDGLSSSGENIGRLLNRKNYYFVPFRQDNPITKPRSIAFNPSYIKKSIELALDGEQVQPILL